MKKNLHAVLLLVVVMMVSNNIYSQRRRTASFAIGGQIVQPMGEFAMQFDGYPAGFGGTFSAPIGQSPFEFGVGYAWNNMGSQNKDIAALVYTDSTGTDVFGNGTMRIRSTINRYQVLARFRPFNGRIQPYADAFSGVEAFKTKTDITLDNSGYSSASNTTRQHLDVTYSFGWAAGLRLQLNPNVFVEGRFENITGGSASYVDKSSIVVNDDNSITFDTKQSSTNKYTYQLGLAFTF